MSDIDLRQLFSERADSLPEEAELEISAVEAVRQCLPAIRKVRKKKMSWETVATIVRDIVQESLGIELRLTGNTVRYYYYQLTRKKPRSPATAAPAPSRSRPQTNSLTPVQVAPIAPIAVAPAPLPAPKLVARSPAPVAVPKPTQPPTPTEDSAPIDGEEEATPKAQPSQRKTPPVAAVNQPSLEAASQPVASTEEGHPNRFRDRFKKPHKGSSFTAGYENLNYL